MYEKLEYCPGCDELLKGTGYDFQYCWICGWGVKERGPHCRESDNQEIQRTNFAKECEKSIDNRLSMGLCEDPE